MANKTEHNFYDEISRVAVKFQLTEMQTGMLSQYCAENGYDCGDARWDVAIATLESLVDQDQVMNVAIDGCGKW